MGRKLGKRSPRCARRTPFITRGVAKQKWNEDVERRTAEPEIGPRRAEGVRRVREGGKAHACHPLPGLTLTWARAVERRDTRMKRATVYPVKEMPTWQRIIAMQNGT